MLRSTWLPIRVTTKCHGILSNHECSRQLLNTIPTLSCADANSWPIFKSSRATNYKLAGIETPDLSILSNEFLESLASKDKPNLKMGPLRRLINDQIRTIQRTNIVQARRVSEQLEETINRYTNRSLTTAEIIAELVKLAKDMREQGNRHEELGAICLRGSSAV